MSSRLTKANQKKDQTVLGDSVKFHKECCDNLSDSVEILQELYVDAERDLAKTERLLKAKQDNEVNLLKKIQKRDDKIFNLESDNQSLSTLDCKQCMDLEKLSKELDSAKKYQPICWVLLGVILIIIIGSL